jgi:cell division protein FtsL
LALAVLAGLLELVLLVEQTVEILYLVLLLQLAVGMAVVAHQRRQMEDQEVGLLMAVQLLLEQA